MLPNHYPEADQLQPQLAECPDFLGKTFPEIGFASRLDNCGLRKPFCTVVQEVETNLFHIDLMLDLPQRFRCHLCSMLVVFELLFKLFPLESPQLLSCDLLTVEGKPQHLVDVSF